MKPDKKFVERQLPKVYTPELECFFEDVLRSKRDDMHIDAEIKFYAWLVFDVSTKEGREIDDEEIDWAIERVTDYVESNAILPIIDEEIVEGFYEQLMNEIHCLSFRSRERR